jgi:hypothetical protein
MEAVADLLDNPSNRKKGGLKVRQNPKLGRFYVEGLSTSVVRSYAQIDALTEKVRCFALAAVRGSYCFAVCTFVSRLCPRGRVSCERA